MSESVRKRGLSEQEIRSLVEDYSKIVKEGLDERWKKLNVELYDSETYEVVGGLIARQATLSVQLAQSPSIWNGHIAPLVLRCMTDAHINLAWILIEPKERARKYIIYGLGQEKLFIEHLKAEADSQDQEVQKMIKFRESWLNAQRRDFLVEVNVGNWAGLNTRDIAREAGCESLYKFAYAPFSGPAHNMWQHVAVYNLKFCTNPLHKFHKVPTIAPVQLDLDYFYRSAKYLEKSFKAFDEKFGLKIDTPMPLDWFIDRCDSFFTERTQEK